jgi:hypothetical protein
MKDPIDTDFGVLKKHMKGLYELKRDERGEIGERSEIGERGEIGERSEIGERGERGERGEAPHLCFPVGIGPRG